MPSISNLGTACLTSNRSLTAHNDLKSEERPLPRTVLVQSRHLTETIDDSDATSHTTGVRTHSTMNIPDPCLLHENTEVVSANALFDGIYATEEFLEKVSLRLPNTLEAEERQWAATMQSIIGQEEVVRVGRSLKICP